MYLSNCDNGEHLLIATFVNSIIIIEQLFNG